MNHVLQFGLFILVNLSIVFTGTALVTGIIKLVKHVRYLRKKRRRQAHAQAIRQQVSSYVKSDHPVTLTLKDGFVYQHAYVLWTSAEVVCIAGSNGRPRLYGFHEIRHVQFPTEQLELKL